MSCNWLDGAFTFLLVWDANIFSRQMQIEDFAKKKKMWVLNAKYNREKNGTMKKLQSAIAGLSASKHRKNKQIKHKPLIW